MNNRGENGQNINKAKKGRFFVTQKIIAMVCALLGIVSILFTACNQEEKDPATVTTTEPVSTSDPKKTNIPETTTEGALEEGADRVESGLDDAREDVEDGLDRAESDVESRMDDAADKE